MTGAELRRLVLSMPDAEEKSHFGNPDFRVRGKIFAGLSLDEKRGTLKLTPELQQIVLSSHPRAFSPCAGSWGRSGWTYVALAEVDRGFVEELVAEAWRLVAPKKLVAITEARPAAKKKPKKTKTREE